MKEEDIENEDNDDHLYNVYEMKTNNLFSTGEEAIENEDELVFDIQIDS